MCSKPNARSSVFGTSVLLHLRQVITGGLIGMIFASTAWCQGEIDYHSVRREGVVASPDGILEGERHLTYHKNARPQPMKQFGPHWSGNQHLLWDGPIGSSMQVEFHVPKTDKYKVELQLTKAPDYGQFDITLDGKPIGSTIDLYARGVILAPRERLGELQLSKGEHRLTFKLIGGNPAARKFRGKGYLLGIDYLKLTSATPKPLLTQPIKSEPKKLPTLAAMKPMLEKYCFECHGNTKPEGEINLERLSTPQHFLANIELTRKIAKAVESGEMPPDDELQPPATFRRQLVSLMDAITDDYLKTSSHLEPVVMRRLNRYEYNNAVRDLLNLKGDIYPLPEKSIRAGRTYFDPASGRFPTSIQVGNRPLGKFQVERQILKGVVPFAIDLAAEHGFNNRGTELSLSPILLESVLKLSQSIVNSPQFDSYCSDYNTLFAAPQDKQREAQLKIANGRIEAFLTRAYRGPIDAKTLHRFTQFFASDLKRSDSFPGSMKKVVSAVLASPKFLYLVEHKSAALKNQPLTDYELATRLSFFLWSSIPDDTLHQLAREGKLSDPQVFQEQVERMLLDRRCQALSENFARQWLRMDQLIAAVPDPDRFGIYYSRIGCEQWKFGLQTMVEPLLLFESIIVEDRSIMLLVDSNYSYRSDELQSWYQDEKPFGDRGNVNRFNTNQQTFKRRKLASRREGGVVTTSGVMTMTSSPLRTNPITRGAWVASVIFNTPPPPPPDQVPEIEADDAAFEAKGLTLRQRLTQHRENATCKACHAKIDPLGFALENYDAVGRWRDQYRSGLKIDTSGKLFGDVEFTNVESFKDAIVSRPDVFMRAFSEHMLSYALGRELNVTDRPAVDRIMRRVKADKGRFSTVVLEVAKSYPFLHKTSAAGEKTESKP